VVSRLGLRARIEGMCALKALFTGVTEIPVGALSDAVAESLRAIENLPGVACPS